MKEEEIKKWEAKGGDIDITINGGAT